MRAPIIIVETWAESTHVEQLEARLHDRRIVALPPPEPDQAPGRVDGWIDHHLRQLLAADVSPPYHLVGWSFGGVIALELARRLRTEGTAIAYVALLDSIRPWLRPLRWRDAVPYHLTEAALIPSPDARRAYLIGQAKMMVHRQLRRDTGPAEGLPVVTPAGHRPEAGEADRSPRALDPQELPELRRRAGRLPGEPLRDGAPPSSAATATSACAGPRSCEPVTRPSRWPVTTKGCGTNVRRTRWGRHSSGTSSGPPESGKRPPASADVVRFLATRPTAILDRAR